MNSIISIENVSKRYMVGRNAQKERYTSLRDVVTRQVKKSVRNGWDFLRGRPIAQTDVVEEFWALRNASFEVNRGDAVGIIGRNGAGKSTLLKVLSRITEPTEGKVTLRGRVASLLEVGTGFHPELTGRENVYLNGAILGMSRAEISRKFDEIVSFAEVERFIDTPIKRYSSGMYVRLAFSVAAHLEPEILIIDEVLAVGDATFQKKCLEKMREISKTSGLTILFVSHQLGVLCQLCKNSVVLQKGSVVYCGETSKAIPHYLEDIDGGAGYTRLDEQTRHPYIAALTLHGEKTNSVTEFCVDEKIRIGIAIKNLTLDQNVYLGIGIDDKLGNRVTTFVRNLSEVLSCTSKLEHRIEIEITPGIIAPNNYSITAALFVLRGELFDTVSSICPFRIIDNGTSMSVFEGIDYGSVLIPATWKPL